MARYKKTRKARRLESPLKTNFIKFVFNVILGVLAIIYGSIWVQYDVSYNINKSSVYKTYGESVDGITLKLWSLTAECQRLGNDLKSNKISKETAEKKVKAFHTELNTMTDQLIHKTAYGIDFYFSKNATVQANKFVNTVDIFSARCLENPMGKKEILKVQFDAKRAIESELYSFSWPGLLHFHLGRDEQK